MQCDAICRVRQVICYLLTLKFIIGSFPFGGIASKMSSLWSRKNAQAGEEKDEKLRLGLRTRMNIDKRVALSPIKIDNANTLRLHKKQSCRYKIKPPNLCSNRAGTCQSVTRGI